MSRQRFLVAYDIREPRRLQQVHKEMKAFGYPLQYSVFICDLSPSEKVLMKHAVGGVMNQGVDSLAIVDLGDPASRGVECFEFMGVIPALPVKGVRVV